MALRRSSQTLLRLAAHQQQGILAQSMGQAGASVQQLRWGGWASRLGRDLVCCAIPPHARAATLAGSSAATRCQSSLASPLPTPRAQRSWARPPTATRCACIAMRRACTAGRLRTITLALAWLAAGTAVQCSCTGASGVARMFCAMRSSTHGPQGCCKPCAYPPRPMLPQLYKKRPLSPDVFEINTNMQPHYKFPMAAISSIANRVTGTMLTAGAHPRPLLCQRLAGRLTPRAHPHRCQPAQTPKGRLPCSPFLPALHTHPYCAPLLPPPRLHGGRVRRTHGRPARRADSLPGQLPGLGSRHEAAHLLAPGVPLPG